MFWVVSSLAIMGHVYLFNTVGVGNLVRGDRRFHRRLLLLEPVRACIAVQMAAATLGAGVF